MFDFRDYEKLIRELVDQADKADRNWKWSVKRIGKSKVTIRWGYLDYQEEKQNCFILEADYMGDAGDWIWFCLPDGEHIECYMVAEKPNPKIGAETTIKSGIENALYDMFYYATSRY